MDTTTLDGTIAMPTARAGPAGAALNSSGPANAAPQHAGSAAAAALQRAGAAPDARHGASPHGAVEALLMAPLLAALDVVSLGLALLDSEARLVYANAAARSLLAAGGWAIGESELRHADENEQGAWLHAVRNAYLRDQRQLFDIGPASDRRQAAIVPLAADGQRWACIVVGRDELCGPLELQMFAARHGLTYAEGEVLRKLSAGCRATEIAAAHGVAMSTVLTQVAAVRSKTVVSSIRDLIATLARLPPLRSAYSYRLRHWKKPPHLPR